jgi:hypothetical protein
MQDAGNLDGAAFALDVIGDRDGFRTEHGGEERCKNSHWAASRTTEDGLKGLTLLLVGSLIEVQRDRRPLNSIVVIFWTAFTSTMLPTSTIG